MTTIDQFSTELTDLESQLSPDFIAEVKQRYNLS